jgi:hypothetical protein
MKIIINYDSKWSAKFNDSITHKAKFCSMKSLDDIRERDVIIDENDDYESVMQKINSVYQTVSQSTVLGVLSRLLGEVRYLDVVLHDKEHIISKLAEKVSFKLYNRELYNEVVSLSTPPKQVQANGGGLVSKESAKFYLLSSNVYSQLIYSVFNLKTLSDVKTFLDFVELKPSIEQLNAFLAKNSYSYNDNIELGKFITEHKAHAALFSTVDKRYIKYKKQQLLESVSDEERVVLDDELKLYIHLLDRIARFTERNLDENGTFNAYAKYKEQAEKNASVVLNITGLLYYVVVALLLKLDLKSEIDEYLINKNGNIAGVASNSGKLTEKDFYKYVSTPKMSWSMPYQIDTKYINKKNAKQFNQKSSSLGIGKECGVLEINIDISEEEGRLLRDQIRAVGVATFSVGKKGLAYLEEINIHE